MKKPGKRQGFSVHQMRLDWTPAEATTTASSPPAIAPGKSAAGEVAIDAELSLAGSEQSSHPPEQPRHPDLVQLLPWDFATTFPQPMPDAIEAGLLSEEDAEPENVKALHDEMTLQLLKVLTDQDEIADARRRGVDPKARAKPTSRGGQERLKVLFETEPARLQRAWQALMGSYEAGFGEEAATAFDKAIRARHAGVAVVT